MPIPAGAERHRGDSMQVSARSLQSELRQAGTALSQLLEAELAPLDRSDVQEAKPARLMPWLPPRRSPTKPRGWREYRRRVPGAGLKRNLPPPPGPSARDRLEAWTRAHAIFFSEDTNYRDEALASRSARRACRTNARNEGSRAGRRLYGRQGRERAQFAVERSAVRQGGRGARRPRHSRRRGSRPSAARTIRISAAVVGETSPNRRVEFEVGFEGEVVE